MVSRRDSSICQRRRMIVIPGPALQSRERLLGQEEVHRPRLSRGEPAAKPQE
jgi:hypothetical protein